jgi:hypothetical protein
MNNHSSGQSLQAARMYTMIILSVAILDEKLNWAVFSTCSRVIGENLSILSPPSSHLYDGAELGRFVTHDLVPRRLRLDSLVCVDKTIL